MFKIGLFILILAVTIGMAYWSAQRIKGARDFFVAGGTLTSLQNGLAITGDYLSAGSFLGIAGLIALWGYDGLIYFVGWLASYITVLLLVAEPLRTLGNFSMIDVLARRLPSKWVRTMAALSTLIISTLYLLPQMVGAGSLIKLMLGIPFEFAVIIIGLMITLYVTLGGMLATTWLQIVKAVSMMAFTLVLFFIVMGKFGFNLIDFFSAVVNKPDVELVNGETFSYTHFLEPGLRLSSPIEQISLAIGLLFGTAGLPHILMRLFTVPTYKEARSSVNWAITFIGAFYFLTTFLGFGAAALLDRNDILAADAGGNMAVPLLAQYLGGIGTFGGEAMMAIVAAVAVATILAVVAGLTLTASTAFAYDLYANAWKSDVSEETQLKMVRRTAGVIGIIAIVLGLLAKGENVAYLVALAFTVAASTNVPVIVLSLFWKRFNTTGAVAGIAVGLASTLLAMLLGPEVMKGKALFPLANPAIITVPLGFLAAWLGTLLSERETESEERFTELHVRQHTGLGS